MEHVSVLLPETIELLDIKEDGIYVDLTLGRGGTSGEILKRLTTGHLYSFDLDEEAIEESRQRLEKISDRFTLIHGNYCGFAQSLKGLGIEKIDGLTADLGVSSPQFDDASRGFSYRADAPLDMRMDRSQPLNASTIVNTYSLQDLTRIFKEYGEDKDSYKVAKAIVKARESKRIETTEELVSIIKSAKSAKTLREQGHPAKQIFQALRIETNHELDSLKKMLSSIPPMIKEGGRVAIITFHSLEDRLVKECFRSLTVVEGDRHGLAIYSKDGTEPEFENLTRKPVVASEEELKDNNRSHSAKLRAIRRKGQRT